MKISFQNLMLWIRGEQQRKEDGDPYVPPPWRDQPNVIDAPEPAKPTPTAAENREAARKLRIAAEARRLDLEVKQANRVMLKSPDRPHPGVPSPYEDRTRYTGRRASSAGDETSLPLHSPIYPLNPANPASILNTGANDSSLSPAPDCSPASDSSSCGGD